MPEGRQIRCRVTETAIALPNDHGRSKAFDKDAQSAIVNNGDTATLQLGDDLRKIIVIHRLASKIIIGEQYAQPGVRLIEPSQ